MNTKSAFLSYASADFDITNRLRKALEAQGVKVWMDHRQLRPGETLETEIEQAIQGSDAFFIIVSANTLQSPWVKKELDHAKAQQKHIVALLLDDFKLGVLLWLFDKEPLAVRLSTASGGEQEAMPQLLSALSLRLPDAQDRPAANLPEPETYNDLILVLEDPQLHIEDGKTRGRARAHFELRPGDGTDNVITDTFDFISPLGPIEAGRLKQYIEEYPQSAFLEKMLNRITELEGELSVWGKQLFDAITNFPEARELVWEWKGDQVHERRFSVMFRFFNEQNMPAERAEAVSLLMATPWEMLHDGRAWLFQGKKPVRVRRRMPNKGRREPLPLQNTLRVLLLSPRPEDDRAGYIDHRVAPEALLEAAEPLGDLVEIKLLETPTFEAFCKEIQSADKAGKPYSVVHFDGHGVFDPHRGLGALCFESNEASEQQKLEGRKTDIVHTDQIAAALRGYRIPFFFLDACQSAVADKNPTGSVAATLLETGVASVAAMSYSVLVSTAGKFAAAFYRELATGARIGSAMLAGQQALHADAVRAHLPQGEQLRLQDWFVPVLFQEEKDPPLVRKTLTPAVQEINETRRRAEMGDMPPAPAHGFVGRQSELLRLERLLLQERYAVLVGQGGAGKTTLATELARWLYRLRRYRRLAFVSLEPLRDVRSLWDVLGRQLVAPDFSIATEGDAQGEQKIARALREAATLIVLDNMESILPDLAGAEIPGVEAYDALNTCFTRLRDAGAVLLFTTRERLPAPFDGGRQHLHLGQLNRADALRLIAGVRREAGLEEPPLNIEDLEAAYGTLAQRLNYHARACALMAKNIPSEGEQLRRLDADLTQLMTALEQQNPGERENSLYASLELSLRRLPEEMMPIVDALAVFHGGADVYCWSEVAEYEQDAVAQTAMALVQVGLAEVAYTEFPYYFTLDPALPPYLSARTDSDTLAAHRSRWTAAMQQLCSFLYEQRTKNTQLARDLARLSEANLLAMLATLTEPDAIVDMAGNIEALFSTISRPHAVLYAQKLREKAAQALGAWSHTQYLHQSASIDRYLEQGNLQAAFQLAQQTLAQCEQAGPEAYPGAGYDGAMAILLLGKILKTAGQAEQALPLLREAESRFSALSEAGNTNAARMASVCTTQMGDCYQALGQYEAAAQQYEKAIIIDEKRGNKRDVAVGKVQLATTRMVQKQYEVALNLYQEAKTIFEQYKEAAPVASILHQIGMVYQESGQYPAAEAAYRESLKIKIREKNKSGEASSLGQLGNLYYNMGRLEDAVLMYERAAQVYSMLNDLRYEGVVRTNLANTLIKLRRFPEARTQLLLAIECKAQFGHAAEPWKTWDILYDLETAEANAAATAEARQKAMQAYRAYRQDGGESQSNRFQYIAATAQAIQQGERVQELAQYLESTLEPGDPTDYIALIHALLALLRGERASGLAQDPALHYMDAVELALVFEL